MKKKSNEEFIIEAKKIHGETYSYEHCIYNGYLKNVIVTCKVHGDFCIRADHFLNGCGCKKCSTEKNSLEKTLTNDEFIAKAKDIHGDKYLYDKTVYKGRRKKVTITCPIHGDFEQLAGNHLEGNGCKKCAINDIVSKNSVPFEEFIERAYERHGPKYLYYKNTYKDCKNKITIVCQEHGKFQQQAQAHLLGQGCPYCAKQNNILYLPQKKSTEQFIEEAKQIHGDKYDYSKVEYDGNDKDVVIICKKHGEFKQKPFNHLHGTGCPRCKRSILEEKTANVLNDMFITYNDHVNKATFHWLKNQHLDFYLPEYNVAIECQGIQHFEPIDYAGKGKKWAARKLYTTKELDKIKFKRCKDNFVNLEYINYNDNVEKRINEIIDKYKNKEKEIKTPTVNAD